MIGKIYGRWEVLELGEPYIYKKTGQKALRYWCKCTCGSGKVKLIHKSHLLNGTSQSCGCIKKDSAKDKVLYKDLSGEVFGRLTVDSFSGYYTYPSGKRRVMWDCTCSCGNTCVVLSNSLTTGNTKSCGCLDKERKTTHNMHKTNIYKVWSSMKSRCDLVNSPRNINHGGRGIDYCPTWGVFENFLKDMGDTYEEGLSLDRIDNEKGYSKDNCRWATSKTQSFNTRKSKNNTSGRTGVYNVKGTDLYYASVIRDGVRTTTKRGTFEEIVKLREEFEISEYGYIKPYEDYET